MSKRGPACTLPKPNSATWGVGPRCLRTPFPSSQNKVAPPRNARGFFILETFRCAFGLHTPEQEADRMDMFVVGDLRVFLEDKRAELKGKPLTLSDYEWRLLESLARSAGGTGGAEALAVLLPPP